ncbi:glycosyltransferase [Nioella nitratireducens]|uniref:glycosyltransferase n=1 Tax=Nioella nitratireducens TaxID=1287720 RepID=UPI0008FD1093|nr:glycosyltransferase [Nioella nitratireducens]
MRDTTAPTSPRVAVVIPVFRHSGLVAEAIESVLAQEAPFRILVTIVNDGCPYPETDEVGRAYARAYPDRVLYLRKPNGGLASARNFGIKTVMDRVPSVDAFYFLDADNRLRPRALARAMAVLDEDPGVDWVYPSIDMFGLASAWDYSGPYSLLQHSAINICEAGSLVRRNVFEDGVLFDQNFRLGWEDWDFFLSAADAGHRGRYLENFGFRYRKRPESMLMEADRESSRLKGQLALKHKDLFSPRCAVRLEAEETPRFAIYLPDRGNVLRCVDPVSPTARTVDLDQHLRQVWHAHTLPGCTPSPPFTIVMDSAVMDSLTAVGALHWVLWKMERQLRSEQIACLHIEQGAPGRISIKETTLASADWQVGNATVAAIAPKALTEVLVDENSYWIDSLLSAKPSPRVAHSGLQLPAEMVELRRGRGTAVVNLLRLVHSLRSSPYRAAAKQAWQWREIGTAMRNREYEIPRQAFNGHPVFPRLTEAGRNMGFLLPMAEFAGVERVAYNIAKAMRARGWSTHAILLDTNSIKVLPDWQNAFDSVNFLSDPDFRLGGAGAQDFLGTPISDWAVSGRHDTVLSMLYWLDCVLNFHGGAVAGTMGQLRRFGVRTVTSLHVHDLTHFGRPTGNTHVGLAYEHGFDFFAPCSETMATWLHGMGVPREKIVTVPNAPGFDLPVSDTRDRAAERRNRPTDLPLRVLFIGRLDRQKGIDRLDKLIQSARDRDMPIDWRVVGGSVMRDGSPTAQLRLAVPPEAPLSDPADLAAAYDWADVVVLLSRYEGLPLTVLEAMRAGAVVVATDVGAISEVVCDGHTGILIPDSDDISRALDALADLAGDRDRLGKMAGRAIDMARHRTWHAATQGLSDALDQT